MAQRSIVVTAEGGLHARPAAELVRLAQRLSGGLRIRAGAEVVDAASVLSLMELALAPGDRVVLEADGEGADAALTAAAALLAPA
ncbi:HPr family phosphocarrier protein [Microbacterium marinilacus]|uniref:Phosphocarrier protein HPr n=1 Tax=Microbacterium marinilacus TaxID=415209 RepID=A0ABP7B9A5_9MICO|nr:HPr family phosphocarrier protein [Microbacterium marinilacus]MBY0687161.1 HPr family phosphocarrier protein [Microbacterium marinilacus]